MKKRRSVPNPLERRHVLSEDINREDALSIAEAYMGEGRVLDSLAFFDKAGASDRLQSLLVESVEAGDVFLFRAICSVLGSEASDVQWRALGEAAKAQGKLTYFAEADRQVKALKK